MKLARLDTGGFEFVEKSTFEIPRLRKSALFAAKESNTAMAKLKKSTGCGIHRRSFVGAGGCDGNAASASEESEGGKGLLREPLNDLPGSCGDDPDVRADFFDEALNAFDIHVEIDEGFLWEKGNVTSLFELMSDFHDEVVAPVELVGEEHGDGKL